MIDLHCHLLPGVDDGPSTLQESIAMARVAYQDGIRTMVVTPHSYEWDRGHPGESAYESLDESARQLEEALHQAGVPLTLVAGLEIYLDGDVKSHLRDGRARPIAEGPYILIELPFFQRPLYLEQSISELQVQGWKPLLAHPERYTYIQQQPDLLTPLVQRGVLLQITAGSLLGAFRPAAERTARWFLRRGLAHCLASDGHRSRGPRAPLLSPGLEVAAQIVGEERARAMVTEVPRRILKGLGVGDWGLGN